MSAQFCHGCGAPVLSNARFCSACGAKLAITPPIANSAKLGIIAAAAALLAFGWFTQSHLGGARPTKPLNVPTSGLAENERGNMPSNTDVVLDSTEIRTARTELASKPEDMDRVRKLAGLLLQKLNESPNTAQASVLEIIDLLGRILRDDPKDTDALLSMADISFNQQVFAKSVEYYERYLAIHPDDLDARARYASSLSFNGKLDKAENELKAVLEKTPDAFQPLAYMTVLYIQKGNNAKALEVGEKAIVHAPSPEAKAKFKSLLAGVRGKEFDAKVPTSLDATAMSAASVLAPLDAFIQKNPIAGPKFVGTKLLDGGLVVIQFKEFPMEAMPPAVREKFTNSIFAEAKKLNLPAGTTIVFQDSATGQEMFRGAL